MKNVIVYGTPSCPNCGLVRQYLDSRDVNYDYIDLTKDNKKADDLVKRSGSLSIPQIEIDGKIIIGFSKTQINKHLGIK